MFVLLVLSFPSDISLVNSRNLIFSALLKKHIQFTKPKYNEGTPEQCE